MSSPETNDLEELRGTIEGLARRIRRLTVAVIMMVLALFLLAAAVYVDLLNYFGFDGALFGAATIGAAVVGFLFGLFARLKA